MVSFQKYFRFSGIAPAFSSLYHVPIDVIHANGVAPPDINAGKSVIFQNPMNASLFG